MTRVNLLHVAQSLRASTFDYLLPTEKIAVRALDQRQNSRLLSWSNPSNSIIDYGFSQIKNILPSNALLILNQSQVITARINMKKLNSGGACEALLLRPAQPNTTPSIALNHTGVSGSVWECLYRGKNIRKDIILEGIPQQNAPDLELQAQVVKTMDGSAPGWLRFSWKSKDHADVITDVNGSENGTKFQDMTFENILPLVGSMPLPPYLKREADELDNIQYKTVYGRQHGSVAAPTAGLHFTDDLLSSIAEDKEKGTKLAYVTLHVGAGTFVPVSAPEMRGHSMHHEQVEISLDTLELLIAQKRAQRPIVAVGTTSVRTLESMYWLGLQFLTSQRSEFLTEPLVSQWYPYETTDQLFNSDPGQLPEAVEALQALANHMRAQELDTVIGDTQLLIVPSYQYKLVDAIVTNFHQPRSTLLMLVAAFVDRNTSFNTIMSADKMTAFPNLFRIYQHALQNRYRFLSYGDSSYLAHVTENSNS